MESFMVRTGIKLWVRDVEEYLFCPMVFYFSVVLGMETPKGYWADLGKEMQRDVESVIAGRFEIFANKGRYKLDNIQVQSIDVKHD